MSSGQGEAHGDRGPAPHPKKPGVVRVWLDGCFDVMHFGHANAMRQARMLGDELYVGVHSDEEVHKFKGPPCVGEAERYAAVRACKWVTHVIEDAPYVTQLADLDKYEIDFVVHGDDLSVDLDGNDSYAAVKAAGKMRIVKRTDGVSTTDIVSRMLLATSPPPGPIVRLSKFIGATKKIVQFSDAKSPSATDKVIYVDGAFDLFHTGHVELLRKARELGSFVVVGVYDDAVVQAAKGAYYPIMNVFERTLSVLACRYVDEVVMGVPADVPAEILSTYKPIAVVAGKESDVPAGDVDPYLLPKAANIFTQVDSGSTLTTTKIIARVLDYRAAFEERQRIKSEKDAHLLTARGETVEEL